MSIDKPKNILQKTFPDLNIREFIKLGSGKYAYTYLVNNEIVFKIPKSVNDLYISNSQKEIEFLKYLYNKLSVSTPQFICSGTAPDGTLIIGQTLLPGTIYSQELHDSYDKETKSNIITQLGHIMRELHDVPIDCLNRPNASICTYQVSINNFNEYFSDSVRAQFSKNDISRILTLRDRYRFLSETYPVRPVITHCDLHFGNLMFDAKSKKIIGLIDFGAAHYDEPARDMHYYYGDGVAALLQGYGDNGDKFLSERQHFQSVTNLLCNIKADIENNKSADGNVAKVLSILS